MTSLNKLVTKDEASIFTSCTCVDQQVPRQDLNTEDEDSHSTSSIDTCRSYNSGSYICCENESCIDEVIALKQCPKKPKSAHFTQQRTFSGDDEHKNKDLANYLGMKDGLSTSIAQQVIFLDLFNFVS